MTVQRRLTDGVLLGVDAKTLFEMRAAFSCMGTTRASAGETVLDAVRGSVVAGGENMAVAHDYRAYVPPRTIRTRSDDLRDIHEVFVPSRTRIFQLLRHFVDIIP